MKSFWIKFEDGTGGCCEGESAFDAMRIAEFVSGKKVAGGDEFRWHAEKNPNIKSLPYPAAPVIWQFDHPVSGKCPTFCHSPSKCAGRSSCPQSYACSE